jgi:hypothetical protein
MLNIWSYLWIASPALCLLNQQLLQNKAQVWSVKALFIPVTNR